MIRSAGHDPDTQVGDELVMNEQLQRLASPVSLPALTLQIRARAVPQTARGQLCTIFRCRPYGKAARQGVASAGHLQNHPTPDGGKRRLALRMPTGVPVSQGRRKEFTTRTTESHRSGGQREP
jgi:hypothetical protein